MKKKPANQTEFMRASEVGAMIEKLSSEFSVLGEGLSIVRSDINKLTAKVDMMYEELGRQRIDITILKTDVKILKDDVSMLKADMKIVKTDVAEIKIIIRSHDERMVKLETVR